MRVASITSSQEGSPRRLPLTAGAFLCPPDVKAPVRPPSSVCSRMWRRPISADAGEPVVSTAVLVRLMQSLMPLLKEGVQALRTPAPHEDPRPDMDEFVTIATYDQTIDAHIALGRLSA